MWHHKIEKKKHKFLVLWESHQLVKDIMEAIS